MCPTVAIDCTLRPNVSASINASVAFSGSAWARRISAISRSSNSSFKPSLHRISQSRRRNGYLATEGSGAPIPNATVAEMAWLAGRWTGDGLGGRTEEIWSPPDAGTMMGTFRLIRDDKPVFYEFLTLRHTERGLAMQLKHFHPDMIGWEEKDKFVEFLYVGRDGDRYHFECLTFVRSGDDNMTIYLALRQKDGSVREAKFVMKRASGLGAGASGTPTRP